MQLLESHWLVEKLPARWTIRRRNEKRTFLTEAGREMLVTLERAERDD